jgi:hypothetical protein
VAFLGPRVWLDGCLPAPGSLEPGAFAAEDADPAVTLSEIEGFRPAVTVVFDPAALEKSVLDALPGVTLGLLVGGTPEESSGEALAGLDRLVTFRPAMTGASLGPAEIWRAIPPPVADRMFAEVRPLHGPPRAVSIGRSTDHREAMLMPAKHQHDLLQVIHGLSGAPLSEMLAGYDVGVYVPPESGAGFGLQVGLHLAAGQLLLTGTLDPGHGLEREIDYLQFDSPEQLVRVLDRMGRFPEMHRRVRLRGRMKAESFRASRLFARLLDDLLADVAVFGS